MVGVGGGGRGPGRCGDTGPPLSPRAFHTVRPLGQVRHIDIGVFLGEIH